MIFHILSQCVPFFFLCVVVRVVMCVCVFSIVLCFCVFLACSLLCIISDKYIKYDWCFLVICNVVKKMYFLINLFTIAGLI